MIFPCICAQPRFCACFVLLHRLFRYIHENIFNLNDKKTVCTLGCVYVAWKLEVFLYSKALQLKQ
jgi:hypothetical protein